MTVECALGRNEMQEALAAGPESAYLLFKAHCRLGVRSPTQSITVWDRKINVSVVVKLSPDLSNSLFRLIFCRSRVASSGVKRRILKKKRELERCFSNPRFPSGFIQTASRRRWRSRLRLGCRWHRKLRLQRSL